MQTEASSPATQPAATETPAATPAPTPAPKEDFLEGRSLFTKDEPEAPAAEPRAEAPAETPKPAEPPAPKVEPASKQLAVLAKRERELRAQVDKLKAQETELANRSKTVEEYEAARKTAAQNPLDAIAKLGLTFEQLQDFVLNGKKLTAEQKVQVEQAGLKQEVEALKKAREEEKRAQEQLHREAVVREWRTVKIPEAIKAGGEKFELTAAWGQEGADLVFDAMNQHHAQTGEVLSIDDAAAAVEEYLFQKSQAVLTTSKVKSKLAPVVEAPKPAAQAASESSGPTRAARTLTNSHAAAVPPQQRTHKTRAEYRAEAAALLKFNEE